MQKTTLLILAAGMGSRYGGLKQMDGFGPSGETIIDYSIYDAIEAGFDKIVFVVRESFKDNFQASFDEKLKGKVETAYVCQELYDIPQGIPVNPDREKPWGTGHAIFSARNLVDTPFAVINADDFYGREAFCQMHEYLTNKIDEKHSAIVGYRLDKTLSENGTVSRGVCQVDDNGILLEIKEHTKIEQKEGGSIVDLAEDCVLTGASKVSMNFWGFHQQIFSSLGDLFSQFLQTSGGELKSEFYIPFAVDEMRQKGELEVEVLATDSMWFGVTYKEDRADAVAKLIELLEKKVYPNKLWE